MAEIDKFEGDMFWDSADTEDTVYDPEDALENAMEDNIVEFEQAKRLPNFFGVYTGSKHRFFTTLAEAQTAVMEAQCSTQNKD